MPFFGDDGGRRAKEKDTSASGRLPPGPSLTLKWPVLPRCEAWRRIRPRARRRRLHVQHSSEGPRTPGRGLRLQPRWRATPRGSWRPGATHCAHLYAWKSVKWVRWKEQRYSGEQRSMIRFIGYSPSAQRKSPIMAGCQLHDVFCSFVFHW